MWIKDVVLPLSLSQKGRNTFFLRFPCFFSRTWWLSPRSHLSSEINVLRQKRRAKLQQIIITLLPSNKPRGWITVGRWKKAEGKSIQTNTVGEFYVECHERLIYCSFARPGAWCVFLRHTQQPEASDHPDSAERNAGVRSFPAAVSVGAAEIERLPPQGFICINAAPRASLIIKPLQVQTELPGLRQAVC